MRRGSCAYFGGGGPKLECYGTGHTSAGGVGIYVKSSISYNLKPTINIDLSSVENLWIEIEINKKNVIVPGYARHSN